LAESEIFDLIILDIMMPDKDGIEVCKTLRKKGIKTPIMMLTGKYKIEEEINGLDTGADDYLIKPFSLSLLFARIRALLRRDQIVKVPSLEAGNLKMDTVSMQVWEDRKEIIFTSREFTILEYLIKRQNAVVTRMELENQLWPLSLDTSSNIVDEHIKNIRKKLVNSDIIKTVRGMGYSLRTNHKFE
jgi:DNA-binding response OmpR family regulator